MILEFYYGLDKDDRLRATRGVGFLDAIEAIEDGRVLLDFEHPNRIRYSDQRILVLDINLYAYCVPYLDRSDVLVLKTVSPNRRFKHLVEGDRNER